LTQKLYGKPTGTFADIRGEPLAAATHLQVKAGWLNTVAQSSWSLQGVVSNERYVTHPERAALAARQAPLDRASANCAVLIPIRKSTKWWVPRAGRAQSHNGRRLAAHRYWHGAPESITMADCK